MKKKILGISYQGYDLKVSVNIEKKSEEWIVCLHGLQSNKATFDELLNNPIFDNYSKLAIDYVGFGESSKIGDFSYDLEDQKNICHQALMQLHIAKLHLIGHSMGGMIGIMLLDELKGDILSFTNMEGNLTLDDCGKSVEIIAHSFEDFSNSLFYKLKNSIKGSSREKWVEMIPDYVFYKSSKSIVDWSKSEKLLKLFNESSHKRMFVYGDKNPSKIKFLDDSIQLAKISHSGHFMILDNYEETLEKISNFINKKTTYIK